MLVEDKTSALPIFFKNRLMWLGFSIPALIHIISGNLKHRPLLFGMIGSILVATIISYLSILTIGYRHGAANLGGDFIWPGRMAFFRLTSMLVHPRSPNASAVFSMITGGVFMCVFSFMHQRFFWWPFHPFGYAMAPTWPMIQLWFQTMLGWLFKTLAQSNFCVT